jgi:MerR family transcriptional regulator, aldehyde-responsive regulator
MRSNLPGANATLTTAEIQPSAPSNPSGSHSRPTESYTVQQAATLSGLSEHTLRYYERIGLINHVQRQESSGHRRYDEADLVKLEAIACLWLASRPIGQMRRYFELRSGGGYSADTAELQVLLSDHLQELHRRMAELQAHIEYVGLKINYWRAVEDHDEETAAGLARKAQELIRSASVVDELSSMEEV